MQVGGRDSGRTEPPLQGIHRELPDYLQPGLDRPHLSLAKRQAVGYSCA